MRTILAVVPLAVVLVVLLVSPGQPTAADPTDQLRNLDVNFHSADSPQAKELRQMLHIDQRERRAAFIRAESERWRGIQSRADWEKFRDERIAALRRSLGTFPEPAKQPTVVVTGTVKGNGYRIDNLVYVSRPGLLVTANLYAPEKLAPSMPGILIVHSHHNPKTQGELQDMGILWAKAGCYVLVPDMLGHGERRQHPFADAQSYPLPYRVGREDYHFRYNLSMQLDLVGESLMGWMVNDLMRGVDVLLARPGIDKERILLLGSVAGGGDPAAVTAALDPRIACVVPFNFGGPQPETRFPLPPDADDTFNYAGSGSWESTRNLRGSASGGYMPWVICASVAPRKLIHAHEFAWDKERDPVWRRYQKVFGFYQAADALAFTHGRGTLSGKPPEATHCNNIGAEHRKMIYPAFQTWFGIPAPEKENTDRHKPEELRCLTPEVVKQLGGKSLAELLSALARERGMKTTPDDALRAWRTALQLDADPPKPTLLESRATDVGPHKVERILLRVEREVVVPLVLFVPEKAKRQDDGCPVVLAVCQEGKQRFVREHADAIVRLLDANVAVCAIDVRGVGETAVAGDSRGRTSSSSSLSSTEQMLGGTLLACRLRDLLAVHAYLKARKDVNASRCAVWGDSFAPPNDPADPIAVPWSADKLPRQAEPLGSLLALFSTLALPEVKAVYAHGGLGSYASALENPYLRVQHDVILPGALHGGDLGRLAAAACPPLWLEGLVDVRNRPLSQKEAEEVLRPAVPRPDRLRIGVARSNDKVIVEWFVNQLR